jgi:exodeoxyribonuclease VII small subunit
MKSKSPSYESIAKQLEDILSELSSGEVPLEQLEEKLTLAKSLLQQCQQKLKKIEDGLNKED